MQKEKIHLITRPAPDSFEMQNILENNGCKTKINSLIKVEYKNEDIENFFKFRYIEDSLIIITSVNSLRGLEFISQDFVNKLNIIVTSDKAFKKSQKLNIENVKKIGDRAKDIINFFQANPTKKKIYYFCGSKVSLELTEILDAKNFDTEKLIMYEMIKEKLQDDVILDIKNGNITSISLFSNYTAEILNQEITKYQLENYIKKIKLFTISEEIANITKAQNNYEDIIISNSYKMTDLIDLIIGVGN